MQRSTQREDPEANLALVSICPSDLHEIHKNLSERAQRDLRERIGIEDAWLFHIAFKAAWPEIGGPYLIATGSAQTPLGFVVILGTPYRPCLPEIVFFPTEALKSHLRVFLRYAPKLLADVLEVTQAPCVLASLDTTLACYQDFAKATGFRVVAKNESSRCVWAVYDGRTDVAPSRE